jgi:hypothetical protein
MAGAKKTPNDRHCIHLQPQAKTQEDSSIFELLSLLTPPTSTLASPPRASSFPNVSWWWSVALLLHFHGFVRNWCCLLPCHCSSLPKQAQRSPSVGADRDVDGRTPSFWGPCKHPYNPLLASAACTVRLAPFGMRKSPPSLLADLQNKGPAYQP